jgi:hypothetical protein
MPITLTSPYQIERSEYGDWYFEGLEVVGVIAQSDYLYSGTAPSWEGPGFKTNWLAFDYPPTEYGETPSLVFVTIEAGTDYTVGDNLVPRGLRIEAVKLGKGDVPLTAAASRITSTSDLTILTETPWTGPDTETETRVYAIEIGGELTVSDFSDGLVQLFIAVKCDDDQGEVTASVTVVDDYTSNPVNSPIVNGNSYTSSGSFAASATLEFSSPFGNPANLTLNRSLDASFAMSSGFLGTETGFHTTTGPGTAQWELSTSGPWGTTSAGELGYNDGATPILPQNEWNFGGEQTVAFTLDLGEMSASASLEFEGLNDFGAPPEPRYASWTFSPAFSVVEDYQQYTDTNFLLRSVTVEGAEGELPPDMTPIEAEIAASLGPLAMAMEADFSQYAADISASLGALTMSVSDSEHVPYAEPEKAVAYLAFDSPNKRLRWLTAGARQDEVQTNSSTGEPIEGDDRDGGFGFADCYWTSGPLKGERRRLNRVSLDLENPEDSVEVTSIVTGLDDESESSEPNRRHVRFSSERVSSIHKVKVELPEDSEGLLGFEMETTRLGKAYGSG